FRLRRLRTEPFAQVGTPALPVYRPVGTPLQDMGHAHDLVGNVLSISIATPASGVPGSLQGPDRLERSFRYNALSQLRSATAREADADPTPPWDPGPRGQDAGKTRLYTQAYGYDAAGNLISLTHAARRGEFTRALMPAAGSNRITSMTSGASRV